MNSVSMLWPHELNCYRYFPLIPKFAAVLDIKDGYTHIPLSEEWLPMTVVEVETKKYAAQRLPFGSAVSAQLFSMALQVPVDAARANGVFVLQYVDDLLIGGDTLEECKKNTKIMMNLLKQVGFKVKESKIQKPCTEVEYLGFKINTKERVISLPKEKRNAMLDMLNGLTIQGAISLEGKLQSASIVSQKYRGIALELGNVIHYKKHYFGAKDLKELVTKYGHLKIEITENLKDKIEKLLSIELKGELCPRVVTGIIATDASLKGIGWVLEQKDQSRPLMHKQEVSSGETNIAVIELEALWQALLKMKKQAKDACWVWLIDNQNALAAFRKQKSSSMKLSTLSKKIWELIESLNCQVIPFWIPTKKNTIADMLSRGKTMKISKGVVFTDISLCPEEFKIPSYMYPSYTALRMCPRVKNRTGKNLQGKSRSIRRILDRTRIRTGKFPDEIKEDLWKEDLNEEEEENEELEKLKDERNIKDEETLDEEWAAIGYDSILFYTAVQKIGTKMY
eukprot:TRINITY_DN3304_c3_g1_i3.p1 TRINITY_DN3304_c3_g1~~TRINITY_DN3304_c3_g1_i3.p1  ORF type:complete len:509 (+),score=68.23 TRINITY_DN3304_c3_g1_i3:1596-3122(+)